MQIDIFQFGLNRFHNCKENFKNHFWYNVLNAWATFTHLITNDPNIDFNRIASEELYLVE